LAGEGERILFASNEGGYSHIFSMDADGRRRAAITNEGVEDGVPDWSSEAGQLLFVSDREGDVEIYALAPGDYFPRNLTNDPAGDWNPDWSPDGTLIAFESDREDGNDEIYTMDADGGNVVRLTDSPSADWMPDWSPDGTRIAFVSDRGGSEDIWVMNADGGDPVNLTKSEWDCEDPAWAPDGKRIAFSQNVDQNWDVYVLDVEAALGGAASGELERLTDDPGSDAWPTWSPDGQRIAFATRRTGNAEIFVLDPESPADSQVNVSRHAADDMRPTWVQTPPILGLQADPTAVLHLMGGDPPHLDPALPNDGTSTNYINKIFSGLVRLDEHLEVVPDIATVWDVSSGGTVYTFHLREDVRFQDGRPMTAHDVKYSLDRACDPELGSTTASTYLGDIVGVDEALAGEADGVSGVRVIDDYTLEVTIDAPKAYFLAKLTYITSYVVDQANIEQWGDEWEQHPNGTGPFRLAMWAEDERIVLVRNDHYYDQLPALQRMDYQMTGVPMLMYEEGDIDLVGVSTFNVDRVKDPESPLNAELAEMPVLSTYYLAFNCAVPPFDDPKVRQAFAYAFDREKVVEVTFEGHVQQAHGVLPPGMPGYDPDFVGIPYDPDKALELLAASSYGDAENLPEIAFLLSGSGGGIPDAIEAFISQMETNLGVEIFVEQLEWEDFLPAIEGEHEHQMYSMSWHADYVDPENFLDLLFHSESEGNHTRYANPELDALLEAARTEQDLETRWELYRQAEEIVIRDAVWMPISHGISRVLVKPYVQGLFFTPMGIMGLESAVLEEH
jgi:ABC-type transport system substrate-binding protein/Tol biopolymer transport system component